MMKTCRLATDKPSLTVGLLTRWGAHDSVMVELATELG